MNDQIREAMRRVLEAVNELEELQGKLEIVRRLSELDKAIEQARFEINQRIDALIDLTYKISRSGKGGAMT